MGCGTSFVKYVLFFFNFVFALAGLALVAIGVVTLLKVSEVTDHIPKLSFGPYIAIIVGAIVFVIAFFGCCGAVRESHCMVVTYAIFLLVIIIVQVVLAILLFVYRDEFIRVADRFLTETYENGRTNPTSADAFHSLEAQLQCCGLNSAADYFGRTVPDSCCAGSNGIINKGCVIPDITRSGCRTAMNTFLNNSGNSLAGVTIGLAIVEVVGAIFALCLANSIRNMDRRSHY